MTARALAALLVAAAVAVVLVAIGGSDDRYRVLLRMNNANGLREGSAVEVGGIEQGTVARLTTDARDRVIARLDLSRDIGAVGAGAKVTISAKNLLGEKVVKLDLGDTVRRQPSGSVIPASRIAESVDLDEVLNVLAPDTRAKLAALIGEAGGAVASRRRDLSSILRQLPPSLDAATELLDALVSDNRTLGELIDRSDRFVARFAAERKPLGAFVSAAGQAVETVAARREDLRRTLAAAPRTLAEFDGLLGELKAASPPLGRAAREITASSPDLTSTLKALEPFRRSASPLLSDARKAAPQLTALGVRATPVVRRAVPTATALASLARAARPLSRTLDHSVDDVIAAVQGWARAIQGRDGLSHMFRAKVSFTPDQLRTVIMGLTAGDRNPPGRSKRRRTPVPAPAAPNASPDRPRDPQRAPAPALPPAVAGPVQQATDTVKSLLDFLLRP